MIIKIINISIRDCPERKKKKEHKNDLRFRSVLDFNFNQKDLSVLEQKCVEYYFRHFKVSLPARYQMHCQNSRFSFVMPTFNDAEVIQCSAI